jgi:phenylpyruvate tautomerase PptA (4-oxalocrotonate tautomerase family)
MPLVRISLVKGKPETYRRKVGDAIHRALVEAVGVPPLDRFQIITEHEPGDLVYDSNYLGIARSADLVIVQITLSTGRSLAQKRALSAASRRISPRPSACARRTRGSIWSKSPRRTGRSATAWPPTPLPRRRRARDAARGDR